MSSDGDAFEYFVERTRLEGGTIEHRNLQALALLERYTEALGPCFGEEG